MEPQPDGTLRGVQTETVLTTECGYQGDALQAPFVATRTGDVPPGVSMADLATVGAPPTTTTPAPAVAGPVLDGTYRVGYDYANQTANGTPTDFTIRDNETHWWAFRTLCTSSGCVATGAQLADQNQQEATGSAMVLHFVDRQWTHPPYIETPDECSAQNGKPATPTKASSWSLEPQPDGTLQGSMDATVLTNDCGNQGTLYRTPMSAIRIGDVPPGVVLADPALFQP